MNIRERKARNKKKEANSALQHLRTDSWCIVDEEHLRSFMTEALEKINMNWFLYDRNFRHERVNALIHVCIH